MSSKYTSPLALSFCTRSVVCWKGTFLSSLIRLLLSLERLSFDEKEGTLTNKHFINGFDIGLQKINLIFGRGKSNLAFPSTSTKIGLVKA